MLIQVALLVLSMSSIEGTPEKTCDDGTSPWKDDGEPNWRCTLEGCSSSDNVCWPERLNLDICDEDGVQCEVTDEDCEGWLACHILWWNCDGKYTCNDTDPRTCLCETQLVLNPAEEALTTVYSDQWVISSPTTTHPAGIAPRTQRERSFRSALDLTSYTNGVPPRIFPTN